jgi:glycine/D-amino acid oxidase-like deaminating enzyme
MERAMRVVICGGGVIGACTAYFLSLRRVEVVVVERAGVACAASGKSGGFLALDWCDGSPLGRLARRSFALHAELAATLDGGGRWGYRRLATWNVLAGARGGARAGRAASAPSWLGEGALVRGQLGTPATTAQVHPARFTEAVLQAAIDRGARLRLGRATGVARDAAGAKALGVEVDGGGVVEADAVVVAMGPWSSLAGRWLPLPAVHGLKGNSVLFRSGDAIPADALFVELTTADGAAHAPEVFPRADGTTYVCGLSSRQALPDDPADVADVLRRGRPYGR